MRKRRGGGGPLDFGRGRADEVCQPDASKRIRGTRGERQRAADGISPCPPASGCCGSCEMGARPSGSIAPIGSMRCARSRRRGGSSRNTDELTPGTRAARIAAGGLDAARSARLLPALPGSLRRRLRAVVRHRASPHRLGLRPGPGRADPRGVCPYKGRTSAHWSVQIGEALHEDLAWSYEFPTRQLIPIAGLIAFYDEQVDLFIDDELQTRPKTHFFDA